MDRLAAMQVFCAVVETGGFSKAAQRLGISTSSVTNQVAALEKHFGVRLLQRTTRSMSLTAEGQQCHAQARRVLADMAALEASLLQAAGKPFTMVIYPGAPHGFHADYRPSYRQGPAEDGWQRALAWFKANGVA